MDDEGLPPGNDHNHEAGKFEEISVNTIWEFGHTTESSTTKLATGILHAGYKLLCTVVERPEGSVTVNCILK